MISKTLALIILIFSANPVFAWGLKGHQITVQIAEKYLTPKARRELQKIFKNESLSDAVFWADRVAYTKEWKHTQPWHYVSVTDDGEYDDSKATEPANILMAIRYSVLNFSSQISAEEKKTMMKFLIHFIGDIHQPLHAGRKEDEGGNKISIFYGKKTNLHSVWDTGLIERLGLSSEEYVARLISQNRGVDELTKGFDESVLIKENLKHRPFIYSFTGEKLDEQYESQATEIIDSRLWTGGVRLAGLLNKIFK